MTKNYEKNAFHQTGTPPPFNLAQSAAPQGQLGGSAYSAAPYMLPHAQQSMLHHIQPDAGQSVSGGVSGQRSMSLTHKGSASGSAGAPKYYNWT